MKDKHIDMSPKQTNQNKEVKEESNEAPPVPKTEEQKVASEGGERL